MKNYIVLFVALFLAFPSFSGAGEDFLGAPVVPKGKTVQKTDARFELKSDLSHDDVRKFYETALKGHKDVKFRDWEKATYIEDDGNQPWHSITISKVYDNGTLVTIVKDNWTWIIGTLILRFIGVFVVLLILFAGMSVSGRIISGSVRRAAAKKAAG